MIVFNTLTILWKGIHITVELTKLSCRLAGAGQARKETRVPVQPDEIITDNPGTETQPTVDAILMHSGMKE